MKTPKSEALEIFVSLLKEVAPPRPVRAEHELYLLSWCREHGVGGFFYKHRDKYFSKDFKNYISSVHKTNVQRNLIFTQTYTELRAACLAQGLPAPVALKGLALLQRVYAFGERSLTDIDVYFTPSHLQEFQVILAQQGFTLVPEKKWRANAHKSTFTKTVSGLEITLEVHTKLFYNQPEDFTPATVETGDITILAPDIEMVYLAAHLVHQHTFLKLFWLMDLHRLTQNNPGRWHPATWELAKKLRVKTSLASVAFCLRTLFGHPVPLHATFLPIKYFLNWPTLIGLNEMRWKYLCMKHTSKDSLAEGFLYDLRWLYFRMENNLLKSKSDKDATL